MGFRTLYIRESDKLRLYLDNIVVETNKGELTFLISDLKFLIIDNYKTTLSTQLINKLTENNVSVVLCNMSHLPGTIMLATNGNYASSGILARQMEWDECMKEKIHRLIVMAKIQSQIDILKRNNLSLSVIERLSQFKNEVQDADRTNREGLAAKMYFREMFGNDFQRFEDDIINAGLNYGYAVFRSLISTIIVSKGLLPNIGIFHIGKTNSFNLADDIIEIYRPIVDDFVFNNLINKELLLKEDRESLIALVDKKIQYEGKMHLINNTIEMYIESIIRCFDENDTDYFSPPSLSKIYDL